MIYISVFYIIQLSNTNSHISKNDCDDFLITNSGFNCDYILEEFPKSKKEIDLLIKNNTLDVVVFEDEILKLKRTVKLITSRSLNKLEDEHFSKDTLKEQPRIETLSKYILLKILFKSISCSESMKIPQ